jgi:hypothetical protein
MRRCLTILVAASVIVAARSADAGLITNTVTSSNAAVTVGAVSGAGTTAISVALDVNSLHVPTTLTFNFDAGGPSSGHTDFTVTLVTRNLDPSSNAGRMNGFDVGNGPRSGGVFANGLVYPTAPTSDVFFVEFNGGDNIAGGFRFGGLSGGGGTIGGPLQTATSSFTYRVLWGSGAAGTSSITFVANPEPATLLLGSMVLAPAAWVVRRRRKAAAELESAPV